MNIDIICIGSIKEKYWVDAIGEYTKRLRNYCKINVFEVKESPLPKNYSEKDEIAVKDAEGKSILNVINEQSYVVALDVKGKKFSSTEFAKKIDDLGISGKSRISFIIGGSLGLSKEVLDKADLRLSFSDMTFPHQMMRVILLEQIYRGFKINRNEIYHK